MNCDNVMETAVETKISITALLLIGVVVGLFVLLIRKKRQAGLYVGLGFSLLVVGGVLFLTFARQRTAQKFEAHAQLESIQQQEAVRQVSPYTSVDPIWQVTVENEFEADLYPSVETAAKALGQKIAPKVASIATKQKSTLEAYITRTKWASSETATMERKSLDWLRHEIHNILQLPSLTINVDKGTDGKRSTFPAGSMVLQVKILNWTRGSAPWTRMHRDQIHGTLQISMQYENEELVESVQFIDKPWVSNFSLFLSQEPGEHYFIAQSKKPCTGSSEARHQALEDAAEQLAYRIVENAGRYRMQFNVGKRSRWELRKIQALVRTELEGNQSERSQETSGPYVVRSSDVSYMNQIHSNQRGKYISDRFVQRFHRSYGDVWREALLVNASKENIDTLAGMYAQTLRQERESWLRIVLSALGMLGMVCVVYVFLNSATKGYYTVALRVAAVVLAMAIIGIAMVLA
jgi:hypothetical protein